MTSKFAKLGFVKVRIKIKALFWNVLHSYYNLDYYVCSFQYMVKFDGHLRVSTMKQSIICSKNWYSTSILNLDFCDTTKMVIFEVLTYGWPEKFLADKIYYLLIQLYTVLVEIHKVRYIKWTRYCQIIRARDQLTPCSQFRKVTAKICTWHWYLYILKNIIVSLIYSMTSIENYLCKIVSHIVYNLGIGRLLISWIQLLTVLTPD